MKAPQIILLVLYGAGLLIAANRHGKPKEGNENFWAAFIGTIMIMALLWWGGFWT